MFLILRTGSALALQLATVRSASALQLGTVNNRLALESCKEMTVGPPLCGDITSEKSFQEIARLFE